MPDQDRLPVPGAGVPGPRRRVAIAAPIDEDAEIIAGRILPDVPDPVPGVVLDHDPIGDASVPVLGNFSC